MEENRIYSKMFTWMFVGLLITFLSGYCLSLNPLLLYNIVSIGIVPIIIIELAIALIMGFGIKKMNPLATRICYIIYCVVTGITFSTIFLAYKMGSIMLVFLITSIMFGIMALIGYKTKVDLTKFSTLLLVALLSIIIVSIINIFIGSSSLEILLCIVGIVVFLGYTAYDMNTVKQLVMTIGEDKAAVYGAFQLYLDFINLFIKLLELIGKSDD